MRKTAWAKLQNELQQLLQQQQKVPTMQPFVPNFNDLSLRSQILMLGTCLLSIIPVHILRWRKPKGIGTLGNRHFLLRGLTKRVGGGQDPSKTILLLFLISKKIKLNVYQDNIENHRIGTTNSVNCYR